MVRNNRQVTKSDVLPDLCRGRPLFYLIATAQVFVCLITLIQADQEGLNPEYFALLTIQVQWTCMLSASAICFLRSHLRQLSVPRTLIAAWLICLLSGAVVSTAGQWLTMTDSMNATTILQHILITGVVAALVLRHFQVQQQLILRGQAESLAQLQALHSRIRPHFLFNSMNTIASLIPVDPPAAEEAVESLAELFRASLREVAQQVTLQHEIGLAERFIFIEQLRFGNRLQVSWDVQARPEKWKLPQLTLQPLLENAIQHGIQGIETGGCIHIRIYESSHQLKITIRNPVNPEHSPGDEQAHNNMALTAIRGRLETLYNSQAGISAFHRNQHYIAILTIPRTTGRDNH